MMSFLEKCSFAPPKVYGGSLQRASSSAGEMSGGEERKMFMKGTFKVDMYAAGGNDRLSYVNLKHMVQQRNGTRISLKLLA